MIRTPGKARKWVESKLSLHVSLNSHFTGLFFPKDKKRGQQERKRLEIRKGTAALLSTDHGKENASPTHTPHQSRAKHPSTATESRIY